MKQYTDWPDWGQSQHSSSSTTLHGGGDQATPSHFTPVDEDATLQPPACFFILPAQFAPVHRAHPPTDMPGLVLGVAQEAGSRGLHWPLA